jgi:hypothetical protein
MYRRSIRLKCSRKKQNEGKKWKIKNYYPIQQLFEIRISIQCQVLVLV